MRLWSFVAVAVLGLAGMAPAFREFLVEFHRLETTLGEDAEWPWAERKALLPWALLVTLFGIAAMTGLLGMVVLLVHGL
jgi:hypothetical protein